MISGDKITIDGKVFVVVTVLPANAYYSERYDVQTRGGRVCYLGRTPAGVWRYGRDGRKVEVT